MKRLLTLLFSICILFGCDKEDPIVTQISFEIESTTLQIGSNTTLTVNHTPSDLIAPTYSWSSSDDTIVSVTQSGVISALELGDVTISVQTEAGLKASCKITVAPIEATAITLGNKELILDVGDTYKLTYQILPDDTTDKTVAWSSSNDNVATVEDGVIVAISEGVAQIKIELSNGVSDICELAVSNVDVESISLSASTLTIEETKTTQLYATINPSNATNKDIVWTSSDVSVATIDDNGNITGVKAGSTTITATTADGEYSATCELTVTEIKVNGITLNHTDLKLAITETSALKATVYPTNAANQNVMWNSSEPSIVSISEVGLATAISNGTAIISATTEDGRYIAQCSISVCPIDELVIVEARNSSLGVSSTGNDYKFKSSITNPTGIPIKINSVWLMEDAENYIREVQTEDNVYLYNSLSHSNEFEYKIESVLPSSSPIDKIFTIRYQFECNGVVYNIDSVIKTYEWVSI